MKQLLVETWKVSSIMNNKKNFSYIFRDRNSIYMQILSQKVVEKSVFLTLAGKQNLQFWKTCDFYRNRMR